MLKTLKIVFAAFAPGARHERGSGWQMLSCSPERYSIYAIQIWLTETESALTAGHLTMFKLGNGKRPFQGDAHLWRRVIFLPAQVPKAQHSPTEHRRPHCKQDERVTSSCDTV